MTSESGRVMIAEDDPVNVELFRDLLESESWEVEIAEDGEVALAKMAACYYDLLLLDLGMPKVNGVDASAGFSAATSAARAGLWW